MNKTKKRLLSYLLLAIGGLNLGTGVSNAQPKDGTITSNVSSENSEKNLKISSIFNLRNGIDIFGLLAIICGGKELLDKNNDLQKKYESLEKKNKSLEKENKSLEEENKSLEEENANVKFDLKMNKVCSKIKQENLQSKYDDDSFWNSYKQLEQKLLSLNKCYLMEMDNFKLLNKFQELFRRYFPGGVKFDNYHFEELHEKDFGDYDIVNFNAAAFGKGVDYMSAYVIQKGSVGKEGNVFDNVQSDKFVTIYYPLNGGTNYWSEYHGLNPHIAAGFSPKKIRIKLSASEKEIEEMKKKREEKFKVVIIKFEELLKYDDEQFKDFYIICEAYRDVNPKAEHDDVYYKFLLVKKMKKE